MTCDDGKDMKKLIAELKKNGEEFDVWYDISNLISAQKQEISKYKNMLQICVNIIGSNEDDLGNDLLKLVEDAKKLHGTEIMLKRCQELGIEDSMKWKSIVEYMKENETFNPDILKHDRQIVKRLEKRLKESEDYNIHVVAREGVTEQAAKFVTHQELQRILEGKE